MSNLDFAPLYRSTIGFDRLPRLLQAVKKRPEADQLYPPYNIERVGEDRYRIVIALAGFSRDDIEIVSEQHRLTVRGKMTEQKDADYIYRGIAGRSFERRFDLADYIEVLSATFEMGLLTIELKREVPERLKPRTVEIQEPSKQAGTEAALAAA